MLNRAENNVSEQMQRLVEFLSKNKDILKTIAEGIIVFDSEGAAAAANPTAAHLLGRTMHEIAGSTINTLIGEKTAVVDQRRDIEFSHNGKTLLANLIPLRDTSDQPFGAIAVFHDSSSEARLEHLKHSFIAIASHEFRTPLNAILGYIDMLKENFYGPLTDDQRRIVERAAVNTSQLVSLINHLLDRAQLETGNLALNIAPLTPKRLLDDVMDTFRITAEGKGLEFTGHVDDDVPDMLLGDMQRLQQILINLAGNGIKFTDTGSVRIRIYMPDAEHWAIEVADTGRGIPKEEHDHIFVPFLQADDPITREYGGTGLGLSIVQQLVTLMNGEIELESEIERGSTFTVVLPLIPYPRAGQRSAHVKKEPR